MPPPDDGWFEAEQPMRRALVSELQRLKRRAKARWPLILVLAIALTAAVMYKRSKKVKVHRAAVTLAVIEGSLASGHDPLPVQELRDYVLSVLLSDTALMTLIEELDLFPLRKTMGNNFALNELRDMYDIHVRRNYFLEQYSIDAPRSARIVIVVSDSDPDFAWRIAHRLANLVIEGEHRHRLELADLLASDARAALARAELRLTELDERIAISRKDLDEAEQTGDPGLIGARRTEYTELQLQLHHASEAHLSLSRLASADEQVAAIDRAGLAMNFLISDDFKPQEEPGARLYMVIIAGTILFCVFLPMVAIFIGTFDTRVHDREDVERIGIPVLGHLPSFPGDHVGSLRARGVRGRRVPS